MAEIDSRDTTLSGENVVRIMQICKRVQPGEAIERGRLLRYLPEYAAVQAIFAKDAEKNRAALCALASAHALPIEVRIQEDARHVQDFTGHFHTWACTIPPPRVGSYFTLHFYRTK